MATFYRKKTYDIIYSLGANCAAATYLNRHFLRVTAGPFDWCGMENFFAGKFEWTTRLICTRFEGFLQKENLKFTPTKGSEDPDYEPCWDYSGPGFFLPHDFPKGKTVEECYEAVKAKYARRIARFYENIQNEERVLLVWLSLFDAGCEPDAIKRLCEDVCQSLGKKVDFLLIWQDSTMSPDSPAVQHDLADNVSLWRANMFRKPGYHISAVMGETALVDPIFRRYALKGSGFAAVCTPVIRLFGRVVCGLIPVRSWRKRARRVFLDNKFNQDYRPGQRA